MSSKDTAAIFVVALLFTIDDLTSSHDTTTKRTRLAFAT